MNRKYVYYIFGITFLSAVFILFSFIRSEDDKEKPSQNVQVENPPFQTYITGTGTVEPSSGNIIITSPFNRVIEKINFPVNARVKKGEVLFQLENQDLTSNLKMKEKKYEESLSNLYKLQAVPREEDLIIAQETFNRDQALFNQAALEYCMSTRCARSQAEKCLHLYKYQQAEAEFQVAQAQFRKVVSGTWQPDLKIAEDEVEGARAEMEAMKAEIARTIVRSPIDGTVLQSNIHEGEMLEPSKAALILGDIETLNLRVELDQYTEPKFCAECRAVAFRQGEPKTAFSLIFLHIEPLMVPKKYLTNELREKTDTQIFEIFYRIEKTDSCLYVGEQMDVYIDLRKNN